MLKPAQRCTIIDYSTSEVITYIIPDNIKNIEEYIFIETKHNQSNCHWIIGNNLKIGFKELFN